MKRSTTLALLWLLGLMMLSVPAAAEEEGFKSIFDGKTLQGWDGDPKFWKIEDGAITGETTKDNPTKGNTFIIWRDGTPGDFELKLEYKLRNHNSGIQVRSFELPNKKWGIGGYQADIAEAARFDGILYGEHYRGILAMRGKKTVIGKDHKPKEVGELGDPAELLKAVKKGEWNEYHIIAKGNKLSHSVNGVTMIECTDEDVEQRRADGLIAFQLHAGPPMKVQFRNIQLKETKKAPPMQDPAKKKIVLIAGTKSHGYASHEHNAGCLLLAKCLNESGLPVEAVVYQNGWPKEPDALAGAATIAIFCDGGGRHPINPHLDEVEKLMKKGVGLACLHYGVEVPKGRSGDCLKEWTGGYFETFWSVNPHWTAEFKDFPEHPVSNGLKPFFMNDEWYYHMRFIDDMKGVTPILTAVPPDKTRERPDGAHSGNPTVRARKGKAEHLCWVVQRGDGGRGFGFTGGHWHWSWACDSFRTVVLNGIVWTAGIDVPADGVPSKRPTLEELKANQDYEPRANYDFERFEKLIEEWNK